MAAFIVSLIVLLAMAGHSNAAYCLCKDGSDSVLQKSIDYACGAGADCSPIIQNGPCFNPNTVKDHCNWAVNSYYQRKGQAVGSCDFSGTATVSQTAPTASSGCVYPSSASNAGTINTPSTNPTSPSTTNPSMGGTGTGTGTGTPTTTIPGSTTGGSPGFGLAPTGTGITNTDGSGSVTLHQTSNLFISISLLAILFSGLMC